MFECQKLTIIHALLSINKETRCHVHWPMTSIPGLKFEFGKGTSDYNKKQGNKATPACINYR